VSCKLLGAAATRDWSRLPFLRGRRGWKFLGWRCFQSDCSGVAPSVAELEGALKHLQDGRELQKGEGD